jgi:hypothetical protein
MQKGNEKTASYNALKRFLFGWLPLRHTIAAETAALGDLT